jgi:hypothetical protein
LKDVAGLVDSDQQTKRLETQMTTREELLHEYGNTVWPAKKAGLTVKVTREDGSEVQPGDTVTDFRGDTEVFVTATRFRSHELGKTGKVVVGRLGSPHNREYYDTVFGLKVELVEA